MIQNAGFLYQLMNNFAQTDIDNVIGAQRKFFPLVIQFYIVITHLSLNNALSSI